MPFRTGTSPFEPGDDDMADFMQEIWRPFATDAKVSGGLAWIEQAAVRGTHPNYDFLFSRGTVGVEAPPYVMFQTTAKTLFIFSGDGINTAQEPYDQPNNPMNQPVDALYSDPVTNMGNLRCLALPTVVGPYDAYWMFGGPTGEYHHTVIKVSSREYRHFHVGMFTPLDPTFSADSFYVTNHRWGYLGADNLRGDQSSGGNTTNKEHQPYSGNHHLPFRNNFTTNITFGGDVRSQGMWIYSPGYGSLALDWWMPIGMMRTTAGGSGNPPETPGWARNTSGNFSGPTAVVKDVGDINSGSNAITMGAAYVTGYDQSLGTIPFACEPTFTTDGVAAMPVYICLPSLFQSELRWGPVAQVPDVFRVNMKSLQPEQEIVLGSDTYVVFPMINKDSANTLDNEGYSGYEGLAYKKITANAT